MLVIPFKEDQRKQNITGNTKKKEEKMLQCQVISITQHTPA